MRPLSDDPDGYCPAHSPALAAARLEARRRGGAARGKAARVAPADAATTPPLDINQALPMRTHEEIRVAMETVLNAMRENRLSSRTGAAMVQAARVALVAVNEDRDERIAELERAVAAQHPTSHQRKRR
jgi:hypothetical protein